ncbi:RNA polymerase sigma-70 factor [Sphingobacterium sp. CZ-2]|uniref:RNA polymerase sigma-70 factor n=1 Tax=Sphingobacterium sp. CZ-2 TaxID=2557994 RepID=UPI00106FE703|nr:RNA polymerase sigma-70 factor [Sphingobacterium sp. CZ-2]QBR12867.1 RNA polymerase sigma-70 factor [Sphingobacterium sp. CZ-2]
MDKLALQTMQHLSDRELLSLNIMDDQAVSKTLFNRYYNKIFSFSNYLLKNSEIAKEICMDVMLKLFEKNNSISLEDGQNLKPYLFRATKNAVLNHLRSVKIFTSSIDDNPSIHGLCDDSLTDAAMDLKELEAKISYVVNKLPEQRKKIFILSREEELTYAEIAERLNISVHTVRNQMAASLQFLRKEFQGVNSLYLLFLISF